MKTINLRRKDRIPAFELPNKPGNISVSAVEPLKNSVVKPIYRYTSDSTPDMRGGGGGGAPSFPPTKEFAVVDTRKELSYSGGLFETSDFTISTAPLMHFDSSYLDGAEPSTGESLPHDWKDRSGNPGNYSAQMDHLTYRPELKDSGGFVGVYFQSGKHLALYEGDTKYTQSVPLEIPGEFTLISFAKRTNPAKGFTTLGYTGLHSTTIHSYYNSSGGKDFVAGGGGVAGRTDYQVDFLDVLAMRVTRRDSDHNYEHIEGGLSLYSGTKEKVLRLDTIGRFNYTTGDLEGMVYEIMFFDSYVSEDDLEIIKNYGNNKYGRLPEMQPAFSGIITIIDTAENIRARVGDPVGTIAFSSDTNNLYIYNTDGFDQWTLIEDNS